MTKAPALSPDLVRQFRAVARSLSAAARAWALYPPEHPSVVSAVGRLAESIRDASQGAAVAFGVTPSTLLVEGVPLPDDQGTSEAARLLHDRDILHVSCLGQMTDDALCAFLRLVTTGPDELRRLGGPAATWITAGHASIAIEQIDYERLLEDRNSAAAPSDRRDDVWRSLVTTIVQGRQHFDAGQQARLLEISRSAADIGDLAGDVIEPKRNIDGSPLITTQAATVLAVFRHLASIVTVVEPERLPEVMRHVAAATTALDPHVVLQMMQVDDTAYETPIVAGLAASFDDDTVAQLLATALARDGKASARLAQVFDTIAPDESRKRRVLTMARSMLSEEDFGRAGQVRAVWASMETLLLGYDEAPYVSAAYQVTLEGAAARAETLAARDLPPELPAWLESLQQDNVRTLSVLLVTDLLRLEASAERASEIAQDMVPLLEDLLLAGDFANAVAVLRELKQASDGRVASAAARAALTTVGASAALREAAALLGDLTNAELQAFSECCALIGPTAIPAVFAALDDHDGPPAHVRAVTIVAGYGALAIGPLTGLADDPRWFVQRHAVTLLGRTGSAEGVASLQAVLRRGDPRVVPAAVAALATIEHPSAARALQTVLRAASGPARQAVVDAFVTAGDARVVPLLSRMLSEADPFGPDHRLVIDTLDAVRQLADAAAVPAVVSLMHRSRLFGGSKARAFKTASVQALRAIGTPDARAALDQAAVRGDRTLKKVIRDHGRS
jgi:HEAT repeat protein